MISSLMNPLVGEFFFLREIAINVNKLFIVYFVYVRPYRIFLLFIRYFFYTAHCYCLFISLSPYFFILAMLLYFCFLINHVNKPIIFVFGAFVYYFKNTISIFETMLCAPKQSKFSHYNPSVRIVGLVLN